MKINITKLSDKAVIPTQAHETDAGFDLTAVEKYNDEYGNVIYDCKIAIEIPVGFAGLIFPRSSVSKKALSLANSVGLIDPDYRGSILLKFKPTAYYTSRGEEENFDYEIGDRVGQIVIIELPKIIFSEVKELSETKRGKNGWGSTGK